MSKTAWIDRWLSRISGAYSFWPLIPSGFVALLMAYLSSWTAWINQLGPIGWGGVGLFFFFFTAFGFAAVGIGREKFAIVKALDRWQVKIDSVNPLQSTFNEQRLRILDISHPVTNRISGKTFTNCELFGPANIILWGRGSANGVGFMNCDFVVVRDDVPIMNFVVFEDCHIVGGVIWNSVIFMNQAMFDNLKTGMPNISSISYEKSNAIN